jgi:hypothetical protein
MGLFENVKGILSFNRLEEAIDAFKTKGDTTPDKRYVKTRGEGFEFFPFEGFGVSSFNQFYRRNINRVYTTEVAKINNYRAMAMTPEIADVIEDAVIECCQQDPEGEILHLEIENEEIKNNKTTLKVLEDEFKELFHNRIKVQQKLESLLRTYFIDGRVYYERLIDEIDKTKGILEIKQLPSETMDFDYNYKTGRIEKFYQYLKPTNVRPADIASAVSRREAIEFNPEQIGYIDYGIYGRIKNDVLGYLEKVKVPYNQLKLLETSVVIYRLIRSPERFVFKIDVGNMPKDKAMKYVEKIKTQFVKKQTYDPQTGRLLNEPNVFSILENFFIAQGTDGKGSSVETIGGGMSQGFTELNDIYYFQKKLYQALKYPMSRVNASQTGRDVETLFMRSPIGEISRDEVKWATFLERQQNRFCSEFVNLFLLHLDFKGLKKEYNLTKDDISIKLTQPSFFRDRQEQLLLETRFSNYAALADRQEMSRYYLMQRFLEWTEEEITENAEGLKKDVSLGFREPVLQPGQEDMGLAPPPGPTGQWPTGAKPKAGGPSPEPDGDLADKGNGKKPPIKAVRGGKV